MGIERLERRLDKRLGWRKKELLSARADALVAQGPRKVILLRTLVVLCYAHLEGFIKEVACLYLDFVLSQGVSYKDLNESFLSIAVSKRAAQGTKKPSYYADTVRFLRYQQHERASFEPPSVFLETGMMTSERIEAILFCLAIDKDIFELRFHWLDYTLIPKRNKIAHGEYVSITLPEHPTYLQLCDEALAMLEGFRTEILVAAEQQTYKRRSFSGDER